MSMAPTHNLDKISKALLPVVIREINKRTKETSGREVAKELGISTNTISRLKNYGGLNISLDTIIGIYVKLGGTVTISGTLGNKKTQAEFGAKQHG